MRNIGDIKCKIIPSCFWLRRLTGYGTTLSQWNSTGSSPVGVAWLTKPKIDFYKNLLYNIYVIKINNKKKELKIKDISFDIY